MTSKELNFFVLFFSCTLLFILTAQKLHFQIFWSIKKTKNTFAFRDFLKLIDCDLWQSRNRIPSKCLLHSGDQSYIFHSVNNHKLSKSKISCIYFSFKNYYSIKFVTTNVTFSCIVSQITWKQEVLIIIEFDQSFLISKLLVPKVKKNVAENGLS